MVSQSIRLCRSYILQNLNGRQTGTRGERSRSKGQNQSIIGALRAVAPKWESEHFNLWWVPTDQLLKATSTPSLKSLMYKKERKTDFAPIMWHRYAKHTIEWFFASTSRYSDLRDKPERVPRDFRATLKKSDYPQVPGSIPAQNTSTQIHMDLRK